MIGGEKYLHTSAPVAVIRRNVAVLGNSLYENCAVPAHSTVIAPYCLCLLESEEIFDQVLSAQANPRCFFPGNWPAVEVSDACLLSDHDLSIPCDARYNELAMPFIGKIITTCSPH